MDNSNLYKIATLIVSISGYTSERFQSYMHPYKEFRINDANNTDLDITIVKEITEDINFKSVLLEDVDNLTFEQYVNDDGRMKVRARFNDIEHLMIASADFSKIETNAILDSPASAYILDRFILISFLARCIDFDIIKIHSSAVYKDGKAIAFLGKSGTGKSTHSKLWLKHISGAKLLNDDEPFLKLNEDGSLMLYGAPWSGSTNCFKNLHFPLKAIVHLEQSSENKLIKQSIADSISSLLLSINTLKMYDGMRDRQSAIILKILERIPIYKLKCKPDKDAVALTCKLLHEE